MHFVVQPQRFLLLPVQHGPLYWVLHWCWLKQKQGCTARLPGRTCTIAEWWGRKSSPCCHHSAIPRLDHSSTRWSHHICSLMCLMAAMRMLTLLRCQLQQLCFLLPAAAAAAAGGETSFAPAVTPFLASSQSPALSPPTTPPADSLTSSTANQAPVSAHPADTLPPHNNAGLPTRPSTKAPSLRFSITSLPTSPSTDLFTYPSTSLPPPPSSTATTAPARTPNSARLPPPWPHVVVQRRPLSVHDDASIAPRPIDPKLANLLMQQAQLAGVSLPFPPAQSNRSPGRMDTRRKKKDEQPPTIDRLGDLLAPRKKDKKLGSSALAVMRARRRSASKHASKQGTDQSRQVHSSGVQESSVNADSEEESEEEEVDV
mmetsp:Transcript_26823/g.72428  ORF Transcript_26823/g.72428 Transcript_26823/m.72428 type:complete len:372 (-) Transcript_26823:405-1520(-)